jgi:hypothetical protein
MTPEQIMGAIAFFVLVSGALWGIWWRIEGKVKGAEDKADKALTQIADHRLHVAETYITKAGMREVKEEIMDAIQGVKGAVDHLGGRIDSMYSGPPRPRVSK